MNEPAESYLKVHYELRPAKQVERRMLVDALQMLAWAGFPIRDYQYTGMGSIYFIDFTLLHRLLGIRNMLSVEYDRKITKRIEFNKPFDCVRTAIAPIGEVIPTLSRDLQHLLWLDYDGILTGPRLSDVSSAATYLSVGSILIVTLDVEPPVENGGPKEWIQYFVDEAADFLDPSPKLKDFAKSELTQRNIELVGRAIKAGITGRTGVEFIPMFNFLYQDGHQMLTMGGMIGTAVERRKVRSSGLAEASFFRGSFEEAPCLIKVPRLTRRERQYLDGYMPCGDSWVPEDFELSADNVKAYREIYRFCPTYAELLL